MKIRVTESDIERGYVGDCYACPVALAIISSTGKFIVKVLPDELSNSIQIDGDIFEAPTAVVDFVNDFDSGRDVEPFEFELGEPIIPVTVI